MPRPRSATTTRAAILAAAWTRFGEQGFDRTTLRSVAADAGVDPAVVIRDFGGEDALFAEASRFELAIPDLRTVPAEEVTAALVAVMVGVFRDQVAPALAAIAPAGRVVPGGRRRVDRARPERVPVRARPASHQALT